MTLYEANYIKLKQIVPELPAVNSSLVSRSDSDCDLHLTVEHQTRYTCELRLTYLFAENDALIADPDLVARIYFDAKMVEVCSWIDGHRHEVLRSLSRQCASELDQRWLRNMMLSKWLDYLHENNHFFTVKSPVSA